MRFEWIWEREKREKNVALTGKGQWVGGVGVNRYQTSLQMGSYHRW
jgi:hypothetical protein